MSKVNRKHILVVDDSRETVDFLADNILPRLGYDTSYALDGQSALQKIRSERPDLMILDLNLPDFTGIDILEKIAEDELSVPVILVTGGGSEKSAIDAFRLGIQDYLVKPFTLGEITSTIERVFSRLDKRHKQPTAPVGNQQTYIIDQYERLLLRLRTLPTFRVKQDIIDHVLLTARDMCQADHATLWLPDDLNGTLQSYTQTASDSQTVTLATPLRNQFLEAVLATGEMETATDFEAGIEAGYMHPVRSLVYAPIRMNEAVIGVLGLANIHEPRSFGQRELKMLEHTVYSAEIALQNVFHLNHVEQRQAARMREIYTLVGMIESITSHDNIQSALAEAVDLLYRSWLVEGVLLWRGNPSHHHLTLTAQSGLSEKRVPLGTSLNLNDSFAGYVAQRGKWIFTNNMRKGKRPRQTNKTLFGVKIDSTLCVPLTVRQDILGVLQFVNKLHGDFDERDVEHALALASLLALAEQSVSRPVDFTAPSVQVTT